MTPETRSLLLPFFLGSVKEQQRLEVERLLLTDSEALLDYLDLKRERESARQFPQSPSKQVWQRLRLHIDPPARRKVISFSVGGALAAGVLLLWVLTAGPKPSGVNPTQGNSLLFDSSRELPVNSDVL